MKSMNETLTGDMVNWRSRLWDAEEQIEQMRVQMGLMNVVEEKKEEDAEKEELKKELTAMHKTLATYEEAIGQMVSHRFPSIAHRCVGHDSRITDRVVVPNGGRRWPPHRYCACLGTPCRCSLCTACLCHLPKHTPPLHTHTATATSTTSTTSTATTTTTTSTATATACQQMAIAKQETTNRELAVLVHTHKTAQEASKKEMETLRSESEASLDITRHLQQQLTDAFGVREDLTTKVVELQLELTHGADMKTQMEARWGAVADVQACCRRSNHIVGCTPAACNALKMQRALLCLWAAKWLIALPIAHQTALFKPNDHPSQHTVRSGRPTHCLSCHCQGITREVSRLPLPGLFFSWLFKHHAFKREWP